MEVFTSCKPKRPLLRALPTTIPATEASIEEVRAQQVTKIEQLQNALENMHKNVGERIIRNREKSVLRHNAKTNVINPSFHVGDFVLVRRAQDKGHKLSFLWQGPVRICGVHSPVVFEVENLLNQKKEFIHSKRLILYRADMDGKEVEPRLLKYIETCADQFSSVENILGIKEEEHGLMLKIMWTGLPDPQDYTWEPLTMLHEDIPDLLNAFLNTPGDRSLKTKAKHQIRTM